LLPWHVFARRYPHFEVGRVVSPLFAVVGAFGGIIAGVWMPGAPPPVINAVLWAVIGAMTSFLVFSSEGPRARPASLVQAAVADGVVTGIIATVSAALLDLLAAAGAGTTAGGVVTAGSFVQTVLIAGAAGLVGGALSGFVAVPVAGRERLAQRFLVPRAKRRSRKKNRKR
jgi:hypothetical protein